MGFLTPGDPNLLLTTVLLPFLLIFVILWGALNTFKLFDKKVNIVISLVITIFAAFTDAWGIIATQLAAYTGMFVYVMFFAVFIIGTILWAIGRTRSTYETHVTRGYSYKNLKELDKQLAKVAKKIQDARYDGDTAKEAVLSKTYSELDKKKDEILARIKVLGK